MEGINLSEIDHLINKGKRFLAEMKEKDENVEFLINEYKTNKRWFREQPGKVTIEDVIKASFEFGWACKRNFDHNNKIS